MARGFLLLSIVLVLSTAYAFVIGAPSDTFLVVLGALCVLSISRLAGLGR